MLVRYQSLPASPRATVSRTKSITSKLQLLIADGATNDSTSLVPLPPDHTCQVRPATVAVPTCEPIGWICPTLLNQIMISVRFTPSVRGAGSSQMSYEALYTALST